MTSVFEPKNELSDEQENILERNLVWIFGANRSGTTWLALQIHQDNNYFLDETLVGEHLGISIRKIDKMERQYDINLNRDDYFFSTKYKKEWQFYLRKLIFNRIYSQFQDITKKVILKEPNSSVGADIISECFPMSRIIILLRDPRDILDSRVDALSEKGWSTKQGWNPITEKNRIQFIERECLLWVQLIKILIKVRENHHKDFQKTIKYEDLRENTSEVLQKIFSFLAISIDEKKLQNIVDELSYEKIPPSEKGEGKMVRAASPGKWKEHFNADEVAKMESIMGDTLNQLGYSTG